MNRTKRTIATLLLALGLPAAAAAQDGVTPTSVLIGQSAAFSGPAAQLGVQMRDGAKLWFDHVNGMGGVHGRQIQLKTRDDKYEASLAAENTRKLIGEDKVFALFAYVGTPTSQASLPIFTEARVPFVAPFTGAELLRQPFNRYVFNVRASYYDETEAIVDHLYRTGARKIAVFHQADSYGQAGLDGATRALTKRSLKVHATGTVQRNSTEVAEAVKTLHASQPDAVVMISAYGSTAEFVRQMKKAGSLASYYTVSFVGSKALADALGDEGHGVMISQVVPFPWSPLTPLVREYLELARRSPGGHQLLDARGVHRREGDDRGPEARGQGPDAREVHRGDGIDQQRRPRRLRGLVLAEQSQRVEVRRPRDDRPAGQVRPLAKRALRSPRTRAPEGQPGRTKGASVHVMVRAKVRAET